MGEGMVRMSLNIGIVNHNIPVLRDIITQPKFMSGDINTNFIKEVYPKGFKGQWVGPHIIPLCISIALLCLKHFSTELPLREGLWVNS